MASPVARAMLVLEEFRKLDPEMPIQIAALLLMIAESGKITFVELVKRSGQGKSSVHRNVALLAEKYGSPLVGFGKDPADRRNNIAWLTPAGERFVNSISHYMDA